MSRCLGVIGGSGVYELPGLANIERVLPETPFGPPSDELVVGELAGVRMIFLPRHGRGHRIHPGGINFRANVFAMKVLGADSILSIGAVGSLREEIMPGHVVVPDQFIDRTVTRPSTFFGRGIVVHVSMADPVCPALCRRLVTAARAAGATVHEGGTYLCMEGPQFSTRAESELYRTWGATVIGMTHVQEARLAREAEMCFATLALASDYDCWRAGHEHVTVDQILRVVAANAELAKRCVALVGADLPAQEECSCHRALENAIVTHRDHVDAASRAELAPILGKYLGDD